MKLAFLPLAALIILVSTGIQSSYAQTGNELKIVFIDVGQGDSTLIVLPNGRTMLTDGGERNQSQTILDTLEEHGISQLDVMVATHPHADHIGGLIGVINEIPVGTVYDSGQVHTTRTFEDFLNAIDLHQISLATLRDGDTINLDASVSLEVLNPPVSLPEGAHNAQEFNNNSVVIKLTYGEFTAIFPGDIEQEAESVLAEGDIDVDVMLASHHGSGGSSMLPYLNAATPEVVVVYAGAGNPYGHPHQDALDRIESSGVEHIFRTDIDGSMVLTSTGTEEYLIETQASGRTVVVPEFEAAVLMIITGITLTSIIVITTTRSGIWKSSRPA